MRIGLHALGIGPGADPAVITALARAADARGFSTLWAGEHVVLLDRPESRYPYSGDGVISVPSDADWLDPLVLFAFVAATTSRIRLATGILLLPEHNPVTAAKAVASLDVLSAGRFTLGVGIGWSADEFAALGVPFDGRGRRTEEYVEAMRVLWRDDVSSYAGAHVRFADVRCYPKPLRRTVPVVFGGNGVRALQRAAARGEGWYGFNLSTAGLRTRLETLRSACAERGRAFGSLEVAVALTDAGPDDLPELEALGVTEVVLVQAPPDAAGAVPAWIDDLAARWRIAASPAGAAAPS